MSEKAKVIFEGQGYSILKLPTSPNLYVVASQSGKKRLYESLGTAQLMDAKKKAKERHREYVRDDRGPIGNLLIDDIWENYISVRDAELVTGSGDEATVTRAKNAYKRFQFWWGHRDPSELTTDNFKLFAADFEKIHPGCSFQPEHKYLQVLANECFKKGYIKQKVTFKLGKAKAEPLEPRRALLLTEIQDLLEAANDAKITDWMGKLLVFCGIYHGNRISEIPKMQTKNLIYRDHQWWLTLEDTKTDENRTIKVAKPLVPLLEEAKERADAIRSPWLIPMKSNKLRHINVQNIEERWHKVRSAADVDAVFHELRHTAITEAVKNGIDLVKISLYFGVSVKTLLDTYVHLGPSDYASVSESMANSLQQNFNSKARKSTEKGGISAHLDSAAKRTEKRSFLKSFR